MNTQEGVRELLGLAPPYGLVARSGGSCPWAGQDLAALGQTAWWARGQPGAAPAHSTRHLSGDRPRLGVRIRPREEPSTYLGASAHGWQREGATIEASTVEEIEEVTRPNTLFREKHERICLKIEVLLEKMRTKRQTEL